MASRYFEWTNAWNGMLHYMKQAGVKVNKHNFYKEANLFNYYCRKNKITGSFTDRVLLVNKDFGKFKQFIILKVSNQPSKN